jgi:membrane-associated protein
MDFVRQAVDFFLHLDTHLAEIIARFGSGAYAILFLIVFCETGLVVTPFLPGDSLLFAAGTFAALGSFSLVPLLLLLIAAAILGDTVNYWIGARIGERAFTGEIRFLKQSHLERTRAFYARHGGKTIVLARFIPIVRTFAPFVAGVARMDYPRFLMYNIAGGITWVVLFTVAGYLFGNIPVVRDNFTLVIFAIIGLSVLPIVIEMVRHRRAAA